MGLITPRESDVGAEEYQSPALREDLMLSSNNAQDTDLSNKLFCSGDYHLASEF